LNQSTIKQSTEFHPKTNYPLNYVHISLLLSFKKLGAPTKQTDN